MFWFFLQIQPVLFLLFLCSNTAEAKQQQGSDLCFTVSTDAFKSTAAPIPEEGATAEVGKARGQAAGALLQAPTKATSQKCPMWLRRNVLVTPLNGPAASIGEWPLVDLDPLQDFKRLHDYYGQEVKKAREDWLKHQGTESHQGEGDLIDLG